MNSSRSGGLKLGFKKFGGNLSSHRKWLEYLVGDEFYPAMKRSFQQQRNVSGLQREARAIIKTVIYDSVDESPNYAPRTKALLRSFVAVAYDGDNDGGGLVVYSDQSQARGVSGVNDLNPTGSPLAIAGEGAGAASYAIFFEDARFLSFIHSAGTPVRPYMELITQAIRSFSSEAALKAMKVAINKKKPQTPAANK